MKPTVIYDGDCGFCSWSVRFARTKVAPDLTYLPSQTAQLVDYGLTKEDCLKALQFVSSDTKVYSADRAVSQILRNGSFLYRLIGYLMVLPGVNLIARYGYRFIAKNRSRLLGPHNSCAVD